MSWASPKMALGTTNGHGEHTGAAAQGVQTVTPMDMGVHQWDVPTHPILRCTHTPARWRNRHPGDTQAIAIRISSLRGGITIAKAKGRHSTTRVKAREVPNSFVKTTRPGPGGPNMPTVKSSAPKPKDKGEGRKGPGNNNTAMAIVVWEFGVCDWGAGVGKGRG